MTTTAAATANTRSDGHDNDTSDSSTGSTTDIHIVFSDVDGTLVHYPSEKEEEQTTTNAAAATTVPDPDGSHSSSIIHLPPSATGMQGIISSRTLQYCAELRRRRQKLVLISGMRTTTLMKRIPYLPRADAYCSEAGGRIFYPITTRRQNDVDTTTSKKKKNDDDYLIFTPPSFDGATGTELEPFILVEDVEWRRRMERPEAAGTDGYNENHLDVPVSKRNGLLWDYARRLMAMGYVLDTQGYSTCFRVNRKQQTTVTDEQFDDLLMGKVPRPAGLGTSINLGSVDFYPIESGKKHCCMYLAQHFLKESSDDGNTSRGDSGATLDHDDDNNGTSSSLLLLSRHALCLCDDDNDLEMALACHRAFVPGVSSESMAQVIRDHPSQITVTGGGGGRDLRESGGTAATERALELVLERITR